ncbi:MAG: hypothetical protein V1772_09065 [Chloroflexota bacterium]
MTTMPDWLPAILSVNGEWEDVLRRLYQVFESDFWRSGCSFQRRPVWWDRRVLPGESYEEGFWHLITRDDYQTNERLLDPRRAERLPWCAPTLRHSDDLQVRVWDYLEGSGAVRTYVWLENWDYVIVLEKQKKRVGEVAYLVTAFHVAGESRRRNLRGRYDKRIA